MSDCSPDAILGRYREVLRGSEYFQISIVVTLSGTIEWHVQTQWTGWHDLKRRIEKRRALVVDAERFVEAFVQLNAPYIIVNTQEALSVFLALGGNALVAKPIAEQELPDLLSDDSAAREGPSGFRSLSRLPSSVLNHAPSKTLRMKVIRRDGWKCRICGRKPENHTDIELHVHHVRPWAFGGLTEERNLITLCSTCHDGLNPHFEPALFDYLEGEESHGIAGRGDLARYRKALDELIST